MNTQHSRQITYDYAERLRARLPQRLQQLRLAADLKPYSLALKAGVSRDMIGNIESGDSIPTLYFLAKIASALGVTVREFVGTMED